MPIDSFTVDTRIPTKPDYGALNLLESREPEGVANGKRARFNNVSLSSTPRVST